ncbi:hypothetical protein Cgig2_032861 [Carnegiea gigantea]|uniref:Protein FAR1-RELATED SEQUENCE n=1 Tax=Carnegiea gigantea TaxID=171969 RepID=A0A9Q1GVT3_9CARY|nr:hypothetical protein Cgig2_032861 [Carnegiea gigantea]
MALDKPRNTSLPRANRPKVPTGSSMKRSTSDESSMRRNLKRPVVESSQLGDDIEEQDAIFRPWRDLCNPQDNINEEYEVYIELFFPPFLMPNQIFVKLMKKPPLSILTDQDICMTETISKEMPTTKHAFCIWHIITKFSCWFTFNSSSRLSKLVCRLLQVVKFEDAGEFEQQWPQE